MSLYVISDLHLSKNEATNKSMEKFGSRWCQYMEKIEKNFKAVLNKDDVIVIPGDISWATKLEEAKEDLLFLDSLPGTKYIGKGNHDFWWSTATKTNKFFEENNINTIKLLYNNAYRLDDCIICGSRGWFYDEKTQNTVLETDYQKLIAREVARLKISIEEAEKLNDEKFGEKLPILAFMHFPLVYGDFVTAELIDLLKTNNIKTCYYGHIHGNYTMPRTFNYDGIDFVFVSADFLNFAPMPIFI